MTKELIALVVVVFVTAFAAVAATQHDIADQCQKKTFFNISGQRFECLPWKADTIYWDPTYAPLQPHTRPSLPPQ